MCVKFYFESITSVRSTPLGEKGRIRIRSWINTFWLSICCNKLVYMQIEWDPPSPTLRPIGAWIAGQLERGACPLWSTFRPRDAPGVICVQYNAPEKDPFEFPWIGANGSPDWNLSCFLCPGPLRRMLLLEAYYSGSWYSTCTLLSFTVSFSKHTLHLSGVQFIIWASGTHLLKSDCMNLASIFTQTYYSTPYSIITDMR